MAAAAAALNAVGADPAGLCSPFLQQHRFRACKESCTPAAPNFLDCQAAFARAEHAATLLGSEKKGVDAQDGLEAQLSLLIAQMDAPTADSRDAAIQECVLLGSDQSQRDDVLAALEDAFNASDSGNYVHRRTAIIKVISHLDPSTAIAMAQELFGQDDPNAVALFQAALNFTPPDKPALKDLAAMSAQWLHTEDNFPSHAALQTPEPWRQDFLMMTHYLAVVTIEQSRFHLFPPQLFADVSTQSGYRIRQKWRRIMTAMRTGTLRSVQTF